jgi:hypothetical protein
MISSIVVITLSLTMSCIAVILPPTEQTSFLYPPNGWNSTIAFPKYLVELTGLSDWPERWETPPFTPEMNASYYSKIGTPISEDVVFAPYTSGTSSSSLRNSNWLYPLKHLMTDRPMRAHYSLTTFLLSVRRQLFSKLVQMLPMVIFLLSVSMRRVMRLEFTHGRIRISPL